MPMRAAAAVVALASLVLLCGSNGASAYDRSALGLERRSGSSSYAFLTELLRSHVALAEFSGLSLLDSAKQLSEALPANISDACSKQSLYALQSLGSLLTLQMLDSFGKPSPGFLEGNFYWMGDFDECVNTKTSPDAPVAFSGQYCKLSFPLALAGQLQSAALQVGACVPSGCSSSDTLALFNTVLLLFGRSNYTQLSVDCHSPRSLDSKAYAAIVVLSVLGVLVMAGTLCDIVQSVRSSTHNSFQKAFTVQEAPSCIGSSRLEPGGDEHTPLLSKHHGFQHANAATGREGLFWQIITSFSCYKNGRKLLNTEQASGSLACINGIRFLSISWVILGHTYAFSFLGGAVGDISLFYSQNLVSRSFQVIFNASVSVDTFFLLSGFLATYLFLKEINRRQGILRGKDWVLVYFHRYIRLTPAYALILMIWTCLFVYLSNGPSWPTEGPPDSCAESWWTNLLYVNNLVRSDTVPCMDWTWYLANDMQFFLITPVLAFLLYKHSRVGVAVTLLLICGSIASAAAISAVNSFKMGFLGEAGASWFNDMYIKPWCRFEAYGVGILLGFALYAHLGKVVMNAFTVIAGWLVAAGCCLSVIYAPYDAEFGARAGTASVVENAAYNALSRLAWSIGVAWVIYACSTGYAGWVNRLLSWRPFVPLARLTYCTYLIHPAVMMLYFSSSREPINLGGAFVVPLFLGMLVISLALAFVASLAFEAPILGIEKCIREKGASRSPEE